MVLADISIELDRPSLVYTPGDVVSGKVFIDCDGSEQIQGLTIVAVGQAYVEWKEIIKEKIPSAPGGVYTGLSGPKYTNRSVPHTNQEPYFNEMLLDIPECTLGGKRSDFPFTFILPQKIPSSFKGLHGQVIYTIKVELREPLHKKLERFEVLAPFDLKFVPGVGNPKMVNRKKYTGCCCCGPAIKSSLKVSKGGFCLGETIPYECEIFNRSPLPISSCMVSLIQNVTVFEIKKSGTMESSITIGGVGTRGQIEAQKEDSWKGSLMVPEFLQPTNLGGSFCRIIKVEYSLRLDVKVENTKKEFFVSLPIVIGTIPLASSAADSKDVPIPNTQLQE